MMKRIGASTYVECSARDQESLNNVFQKAVLSTLLPPGVCI